MILTDDIFFADMNGISYSDFGVQVSTSLNYQGNLSHSDQFRNACLLCFGKMFNNSDTDTLDQIILYSKSLPRKAATNTNSVVSMYMDNIVYGVDQARSRQNNQPNKVATITLVGWNDLGKDRRSEIIARIKEDRTKLTDGQSCTEIPFARTLLTLNPTTEVHAFQLGNTNDILILTNQLNDNTLQLLPLLITHTLRIPITETVGRLITNTSETDLANIVYPTLKKLEEDILLKRAIETLPTFTDLIDYRHNVESMKEMLTTIVDEYKNRLLQLSDTGIKMAQMQKDILYAENKKTSTNDLIEYIKAYGLGYVHAVEKYNNRKAHLCLKVPMLYWYNEDFEILINNKDNNDLHNYSAEFLDFLQEIFINRTYTILTYTAVTLILDNNELRYSCSKDTTDYLSSYMVHHPHLYHFNCWGDNDRLLRQAIIEDDSISFWNGLITTLSSINLADGPVFRRYIADIYKYATSNSNTNAKLRTKDGKELTIKQAYKEFLTATVAPQPVPVSPTPTPVSVVEEPIPLDPVDLIF